jgi:hypothetical protein
VRQAQADLLYSAAQLGVVPSSYNLTPKQTLEEFYRRDPSGDLDRIYAALVKTAPSLKQAETNLEQPSAISIKPSSICAIAQSLRRSTVLSPAAT